MRQKDTRRLLQMVETTAKVPIVLGWQDCTKQHGVVAESAKRQQAKEGTTCIAKMSH